MEKQKTQLTLLGIWNILPVGTWTWSNDVMVEQLERLTRRSLGIFYFIKGDDLVYECFVKKDTDQLKEDLEKLSSQDQVKYVQRITDDYYQQVRHLEVQLKITEKQIFSSLDNKQLSLQIKTLSEVWSRVTVQIWYAVLLDIWYPSEKDRADLKSIIAPARDHCGHLHERSDKIEHEMYSEVARRLGFTDREVYFMIQPEIINALNGSKISKEKLALRFKLWVQSNHSGKTEIYEGDEAERLINQFAVPSIGQKKDNLKGTPACRGKVQGEAHVILLDKDFSEFKEGEILVSLQTMVHYLPIMKKSVAILTEFGGLTSHAAIVSRELKKPCVVGISGLIASVKTGDTLEIDADKGIVKIL